MLQRDYIDAQHKAMRSRSLKRKHRVKCKWLEREILRLLNGQNPHSTPSLPARVSQEALFFEGRELMVDAMIDPTNDYYW